MAATGTTYGITYIYSQLLGLLVVVLTKCDSSWDYQWQYLRVVTATRTSSGSAYIY